MALDQAKIAELKAEHGPILVLFNTEDLGIESDHHAEVVIRPPTRSEFKRFLDQVQDDDKSRAAAIEDFATDITVYPSDPKEKKAIFERFPGLPGRLSAKGQELGGMSRKLEGKAL